MKRSTLAIFAALALTASGAMAQSTINTPAPGPTQQEEPGQTNNNLPNPGNPQTQVDPERPVVDETNTMGTTGQSTTTTGTQTGQTGTTTTGTVSGSTGTLQTEVETDVDMDVENDANTTSSTMDDQTGTYSGTTETADQSYAGGDTLPATGSELPLVALIGLLALGAAFTVRLFVK